MEGPTGVGEGYGYVVFSAGLGGDVGGEGSGDCVGPGWLGGAGE